MLLSVGLALAVAGTAAGSERSRGAADAGRTAVATETAWQQVSPGTAEVRRGETTLTVHADGRIDLDEVIAAYGSAEAYERAVLLATVPVTTGPDGGQVAANGAMFHSRDWMSQSDPGYPEAQTSEEYKSQSQWSTTSVNGVDVTVFADGAVFADQASSLGQAAQGNGPHVTGQNGEQIYANGSVWF